MKKQLCDEETAQNIDLFIDLLGSFILRPWTEKLEIRWRTINASSCEAGIIVDKPAQCLEAIHMAFLPMFLVKSSLEQQGAKVALTAGRYVVGVATYIRTAAQHLQVRRCGQALMYQRKSNGPFHTGLCVFASDISSCQHALSKKMNFGVCRTSPTHSNQTYYCRSPQSRH